MAQYLASKTASVALRERTCQSHILVVRASRYLINQERKESPLLSLIVRLRGCALSIHQRGLARTRSPAKYTGGALMEPRI